MSRWADCVPAESVRRHLRRMKVSNAAISRATNGVVSESSVAEIRSGRRKFVLPSTARILLEVPGDAKPRKVPRIGAQRRLRALMWMGWPGYELDGRIGCRASNVLRHDDLFITRELHDRISVVYDELCMTFGPSPITRRVAIRLGFAPPLAWNEENIDWPGHRPTGERVSGGPKARETHEAA